MAGHAQDLMAGHAQDLMAGHAHHHTHKTYSGQATVIITVFIVALLYIFWGNNPTIVNVAENTFDLTRDDLRMIPFSGLAFFAFYLLMSKVFFTPVLALIETREALTDGAQSSAQDLIKAAEDLKKGAEQKLFDARLSGAQTKIAALGKARSAAQKISDEAQAAVSAQLKAGRTEIAANTVKLQDQITGQLDELTANAVKKIMEIPSEIDQRTVNKELH